MERTKGMKKGMKAAVAMFFLVAALASMGCSNNMLTNPSSPNSANGTDTTAQQGGHTRNG